MSDENKFPERFDRFGGIIGSGLNILLTGADATIPCILISAPMIDGVEWLRVKGPDGEILLNINAIAAIKPAGELKSKSAVLPKAVERIDLLPCKGKKGQIPKRPCNFPLQGTYTFCANCPARRAMYRKKESKESPGDRDIGAMR